MKRALQRGVGGVATRVSMRCGAWAPTASSRCSLALMSRGKEPLGRAFFFRQTGRYGVFGSSYSSGSALACPSTTHRHPAPSAPPLQLPGPQAAVDGFLTRTGGNTAAGCGMQMLVCPLYQTTPLARPQALPPCVSPYTPLADPTCLRCEVRDLLQGALSCISAHRLPEFRIDSALKTLTNAPPAFTSCVLQHLILRPKKSEDQPRANVKPAPE